MQGAIRHDKDAGACGARLGSSEWRAARGAALCTQEQPRAAGVPGDAPPCVHPSASCSCLILCFKRRLPAAHYLVTGPTPHHWHPPPISRRPQPLRSRPSRLPSPQGAAAGSKAQAELAVLDALRSAKGRGKEGLSEEAQQQLALAVSVLEANGGVAGACRVCCVRASTSVCAAGGGCSDPAGAAHRAIRGGRRRPPRPRPPTLCPSLPRRPDHSARHRRQVAPALYFAPGLCVPHPANLHR